jgi:hypothetical protein
VIEMRMRHVVQAESLTAQNVNRLLTTSGQRLRRHASDAPATLDKKEWIKQLREQAIAARS